MFEVIKGRRTTFALAVIWVAAIAVRYPYLGDPAPDSDEQFYFVVGNKILQGYWPYVDIWDRKPVLLFLIYAATSAASGGAPIGYQLLALIFAAIGATQVYALARRLSGQLASFIGAIVYLLSFPMFFAPVGQSEVFFVPLLLGMLQLLARMFETDDPGKIARSALLVMLLGSLALQIKYTVLPHCAFAGIAALWRYHRLNCSLLFLARMTATFIAIGLLPTAIVAVVYATNGHFEEFRYANFVSIFERGELRGAIRDKYRILVFGRALVPVALAAAGIMRVFNKGSPGKHLYILIAGFTLASATTFVMVGNIYIHYFIPVMPGLILLAVPFVGARPANLAIGLAAATFAFYQADFPLQFIKARQEPRAISQLMESVAPYVNDKHCLYVYDGPSVLYQLSRTCLPTKFAYPDHLNNAQEKRSLGVDTEAEVRRILQAEPGAIITANFPMVPRKNLATSRLVTSAVTTRYVKVREVFFPPRRLSVYVLDKTRK